MSKDPAVFHKALEDFIEHVYLKAVRRAKEHDRPMDLHKIKKFYRFWNRYWIWRSVLKKEGKIREDHIFGS